MKNKSQEEIEKENAEKEEAAILEEERKRINGEKYFISDLGGWLIIPSSAWIIYFIYAGWDYFVNKNTNVYFLVIFGIVAGACLFYYNSEEIWEKRLKAKAKLRDENSSHPLIAYFSDYIYTDSKMEYSFLWLAKIICFITNFAIIILLGILLFEWLGGISIAPTTIIIFLLIIIVFNQYKSK